MRRLLMLTVVCLFVTNVFAATETFEGPKSCVRCGMSRVVFAYSRVVVTYADGSSSGTCSIHCAVEHIKLHREKQVATLKVADYHSRELIDAKSATWVVGGKKGGVMTSPAKWAFSREGEARKFVEKNGGSITPFDLVMKAVNEEVAQMDKTDGPD